MWLYVYSIDVDIYTDMHSDTYISVLYIYIYVIDFRIFFMKTWKYAKLGMAWYGLVNNCTIPFNLNL